MRDRWYHVKLADGAAVHVELVKHGRHLDSLQRSHAYLDVIHERIYRGSALLARGLTAAMSALGAAGYSVPRLNVTKSVVDTAVSKLGKDRPMPQAVVDDADWSIKRKARKFTRFIRGEMRATDFDETSQDVLRKAAVRCTGIMKVSTAFGRIVLDDVPRHELLVDPRDGQYGRPRQFVQRKLVPREVLAEMFPERRDEIMAAARTAPTYEEYCDEYGTLDGYDTSDLIEVFEGWHLASGSAADMEDTEHDGRHAVVIEGATLEYGPWTRPYPPFAFVHWSKPLRGFWGRGLVEEVAPIQESINAIVRDIQGNIEYHGRAIVLTRKGSNIPTGHLTGRKPFKLEFDGPQPPQFFVPNVVSPAQFQMLEKLERSAYDLTGVSMLSARSQNPLGAGASGRALDNFYDIQSERFAELQAAYARFRMQGGRLIMDAAYDLATEAKESKRKYSVSWSDRGKMTRMEWAEVELDREQVRLELEPVNFLPDTRSGKLREVEQLAQAGVIDQKMASALFDEPDIERANRIRNAAFNNLERLMEALGDEDVPLSELTPEPFHNRQLGAEMGVAWYNRAQAEGAPEHVLERFRWWLDMLRKEAEFALPKPPEPVPPGPESMPTQPGMPDGAGAGMPLPAPGMPM